jgi:hypothetical protein
MLWADSFYPGHYASHQHIYSSKRHLLPGIFSFGIAFIAIWEMAKIFWQLSAYINTIIYLYCICHALFSTHPVTFLKLMDLSQDLLWSWRNYPCVPTDSLTKLVPILAVTFLDRILFQYSASSGNIYVDLVEIWQLCIKTQSFLLITRHLKDIQFVEPKQTDSYHVKAV